jgi:hypothetical protein
MFFVKKRLRGFIEDTFMLKQGVKFIQGTLAIAH